MVRRHIQGVAVGGLQQWDVVSVATARAIESQLSGCCALNELGKIMKILVEPE